MKDPLGHLKIILAVGAFIVKDHQSKILIVRKSPYEKIDGGLWTIPGGKVNPKEPIISALKREVKEEVGLTIKTYQWIGEDVFQSNSYWFHSQHFLCTVLPSDIKLEKNLLDFHWLKKDEINNFDFPVNIKKRILEILK